MTIMIWIFTAILVPVLIGECVDWLPWVGTRLIRRAANRLPPKHRARYEEEWQAEFNVLPGGKLTKLAFGLRIYAGARSTGAALVEVDNLETAKHVLMLAEQCAYQAIEDARREADETLGRARREAQKVLDMAYTQAAQIVHDARHLASVEGRSAGGGHQPPEVRRAE